MSSRIKTKKRKRLTLEIKLEIYKRIKEGILPSLIEREYNISKSSVSQIKHFSGPKIQQFLFTNPHLQTIMRMKSSYPILDEQLLEFFQRQRALGKPLSSDLLYEEARSLDSKMDYPESHLTKGFIKNFLERHNIRKVKCLGERASVDNDSVESF